MRPVVRRRHHHAAWRFLASPRVLAIGDLALLFGAFLLAYTARYTWRLGPALNEFQFTPLDPYWVVAGLFIPVTLLSFAGLGRYQPRRASSLLDDIARIAMGALIGTAAVIVVFFVSRPVFFSRLMFLYLGAFGLGFPLSGCSCDAWAWVCCAGPATTTNASWLWAAARWPSF